MFADYLQYFLKPGKRERETDRQRDRETETEWGTWVAQSVEHPTSAQVMISQSVSSSLALGSMLTTQSLEPASDFVSSLCPSSARSLSLSLSQK